MRFLIFLLDGASLFYISKYKPTTLLNLRNYILHRLFASSEIRFPYNLKSQVIDRDSVMVPIGWDSWGKIKALRDEFDVEGFEYEKKVVPYTTVGNSLSIQSEIVAEDEQAFLGRQLEVLNSMGGKVVAPNSPKIDSLEDISAKLAKLSKLKESSSPSTPIRERKSGIDVNIMFQPFGFLFGFFRSTMIMLHHLLLHKMKSWPTFSRIY